MTSPLLLMSLTFPEPMSYSLSVTESGGLTLGLTGPAGPSGPTGPAGGVTSVAGRTGAITLVSLDVSDATSVATANTLVKRDANGDFFGEACGFTTVNAGGGVNGITIGSDGVYFYVLDAQALLRSTATQSQVYTLPDSTGTLPTVPAYANLTAANAALPADEFYWDTTDKKLRVTTA